MTFKNLTYRAARKLSILKWEMKVKGEDYTLILNRHAVDYGRSSFRAGCPFCEYFFGELDGCQRDGVYCPLYDPNQNTETKSFYAPHSCWPCTRDYWRYAYWLSNSYLPDGERKILYYAKKILKQLKDSPTTLKELKEMQE